MAMQAGKETQDSPEKCRANTGQWGAMCLLCVAAVRLVLMAANHKRSLFWEEACLVPFGA